MEDLEFEHMTLSGAIKVRASNVFWQAEQKGGGGGGAGL